MCVSAAAAASDGVQIERADRNQVIFAVGNHCAMQHRVKKEYGET
jgi:hypothetical protein